MTAGIPEPFPADAYQEDPNSARDLSPMKVPPAEHFVPPMLDDDLLPSIDDAPMPSIDDAPLPSVDEAPMPSDDDKPSTTSINLPPITGPIRTVAHQTTEPQEAVDDFITIPGEVVVQKRIQ